MRSAPPWGTARRSGAAGDATLGTGPSLETRGVILQPRPLHEEKVGARTFDAARQGEAFKAGHAGDDRLGSCESRLEVGFLAGLHLQDSVFEDHGSMMARMWMAFGNSARIDRCGLSRNTIVSRDRARPWRMIG